MLVYYYRKQVSYFFYKMDFFNHDPYYYNILEKLKILKKKQLELLDKKSCELIASLPSLYKQSTNAPCLQLKVSNLK